MYKAEFDKHLRAGNISNALIFFGEDTFLIDMYTTLMSNQEDANKLVFYYDEYNFETAKAHLSQGSLFGGNNILVIKSEKKINKKELETFIQLCEKNPDNIFIYAYYGSDHKTYTKAFAKTQAMSVRFFHPNEYEAQNILLHLAQEKGVKIDKYTLIHLLNIHNGDLSLSANELDKLAIYNREITTKDVDTLVFGLAQSNLDTFYEKLLNKKDIVSDIQNILEHGEDEIKIITSITSYLTQLYMFNIYIRVNGQPNAKEILGYAPPAHIVKEKVAQALRIKPPLYYQLHTLLLDTELKMKTASADKNALLLAALIKIQKIL